MPKVRLDTLVQQRIECSLSKAQGLIQTGKVRTPDGTPLRTAGESVDDEIELSIDEGSKYVSRGGQKLEAGIEKFPFSVKGQVAIDVGASTGGFTDCLLQNGARKVYAVDVGYGQLDWKLRQDPRVVVMERTNIRNVTPDDLDEIPAVFVADCSFISLKLVVRALVPLLAEQAEGIVLIKPQFEARKNQVGEGGVIRDPEIHREVIENVSNEAVTLGFSIVDVIPSPIEGPAGNKEFLACLKRGG
ncbi:MAG TPA: TlyA family RNA methyltransferase [Candidatus Hydrogenedentes bacterium]|nr:TlyA family RNA methyltransferase [Candidatus Hydrogenedentota bacterium]